MTDVALFVPCFVDQFHPSAGIAAVELLETLGYRVHIAGGARCCGQPATNAGLASDGHGLTERFVQAHAREVPPTAPIVVLSGSCAMHLRTHTSGTHAGIASRTIEFSAFLHDVVGLSALASLKPVCEAKVALHMGCHTLRGLGLATPSERMLPPMNKLAAVLSIVRGLEIIPLARPDECCGFGGTFALTEPDISVRMGRDRLREMQRAQVDALVSTDLSCTLHLDSIARNEGSTLPMWHLAEVLTGKARTA